jgi:hypothetical protein
MSITEAAAVGVRYIRAADGDAFWTVGDTYTIKASASITGGAYSLVEASVPPFDPADAPRLASISARFGGEIPM